MDPAVTAAAIKWEKAKAKLSEMTDPAAQTVADVKATEKERYQQCFVAHNAKKNLALAEKVTGTYYQYSDSWDDWWD
tara:strand:- start:529 stop:759 length:231 start_codon:yes stop_codon:yes gene_type:complete